MTDRIAIIVGLVLILCILADLFVFQWGATLFLLRRLAVLVDWVAFWR